MQKELQDKYKEKWERICPETGKNKFLWMIGEIGEVIDITINEQIQNIAQNKDTL